MWHLPATACRPAAVSAAADMPLGGLLLLLSSAMVSSNLELHKYATGRQARVVTAMTLLKSHLFR
jgi:hypothetical protein